MGFPASVFQDLRKQVAPLLKSFQGEVRASSGCDDVFSAASHEPGVLAGGHRALKAQPFAFCVCRECQGPEDGEGAFPRAQGGMASN